MATDPLSYYVDEWRRISVAPAMVGHRQEWARVSPRLAAVADLDAALQDARTRRAFDRTDTLLHALLQCAGGSGSAATVAATAVAAHLVPGAGRVAQQVQEALQRSGQSVPTCDVRSTVSGCLWDVVRCYPLHRTRAVAANVVREVLSLALRTYDCHPRCRGRGRPTPPDELRDLFAGVPTPMQPSEELVRVLAWALARHKLTAEESALLVHRWTTADKPVSTRQLGVELGWSQRTTARRCAQAQQALAAAVADAA